MIDAITETKEEVRASQQAMINTCIRAGLNPKVLAALLDVEESYIRQIRSRKSTFVASARIDRSLFRITSKLDQDHYVETLLSHGKYVTTDGDGETNDSYLDELLDGQEALGGTTRAARTHDHHAARDFFRMLKAIAVRGEKESVRLLRT